ncbi:MAG: hypothetical protein AB7I27_05395 [Bacteriovoracaceae bacterium]
MKVVLLLFPLFLVSCATKYILPANRFMTPESQGGSFRGQFEFQATKAQESKIDASSGNVTSGVKYKKIYRTGYFLQASLLEQFDFYWSHIGSGLSLFGGKFQFLGASRSAKGTGHKMAFAGGFGGNSHDPDDQYMKTFTYKGQEFLLIYGYRFTENILPYASLNYARYNMNAVMGRNAGVVDGDKVSEESKIKSLSGGLEFNHNAWVMKFEYTAQLIGTDRTQDKTCYIAGYSLGYSW